MDNLIHDNLFQDHCNYLLCQHNQQPTFCVSTFTMSSIQTQTGEQEEDDKNNRNDASKDTLQPVNSGDQSQNRNGGGGDESRKGSRIGINAPAPPHKFVKVSPASLCQIWLFRFLSTKPTENLVRCALIFLFD